MFATPKIRAGTVAISLIAVLGMTGCGAPKPIADMASAKTAISFALTEDAETFAPVELDRARTKLKQAERAAAEGDNEEARRLAKEAQADAILAWAKADSEKTKMAVKELEASIQRLQQQLGSR